MALIRSISQFKDYIGTNVYVVSTPGLFIASTTKAEINGELRKMPQSEFDNLIFSLDDPTSIFDGLVLDPKELPYEIPFKFSKMGLYLLSEGFGNTVDCTPYDTVEELTEEIENMIGDDFAIDDFAIILGAPLTPSIQITATTIPIDCKKVYGEEEDG